MDGWQWKPDLIWFDNLTSVRSANWYVQMLYGTNRGTNMLKLTENGKPVTGTDGLYASAVYDKDSKSYIVKIGNASDKEQTVTLGFNNLKQPVSTAKVTLLQSSDIQAENSIANKTVIVPQTSELPVNGTSVKVILPAKSFTVYRF